MRDLQMMITKDLSKQILDLLDIKRKKFMEMIWKYLQNLKTVVSRMMIFQMTKFLMKYSLISNKNMRKIIALKPRRFKNLKSLLKIIFKIKNDKKKKIYKTIISLKYYKVLKLMYQ